jgi:DNA-binding PadR family transcriptional regulator
VLDLALLGLLKERPMHGYDLRKRLREDFGALANLSFGSIYPALARLEQDGAIRTIETPADSEPARIIPSTGSLSGEWAAFRARQAARQADRTSRQARGSRGRKVYEITPLGDERFEQLLAEDDGRAEDSRGFSLKLAFARHLSPEARLRLFERRRALLIERLSRSRRSMASPRRPLDPYERSLAEHDSETTQHDISWLEKLIDAERGDPADSALTGRTNR